VLDPGAPRSVLGGTLGACAVVGRLAVPRARRGQARDLALLGTGAQRDVLHRRDQRDHGQRPHQVVHRLAEQVHGALAVQAQREEDQAAEGGAVR
jgi:hypothetical protein